jgi:Flp pilus assembly protein TadD
MRCCGSPFARYSIEFRLGLSLSIYRHTAIIAAAIALASLVNVARGADSDPSPTGSATPEISEASRKAYAESMRDARSLLTQKKYDEAIAKLDQLASERPREPQARFLKAVALTDQKKPDVAISAYRALVADFPEMPEPHNNLAVLYAQKGELALARDELLLAIATAPDYALAYENLGDVYAQLAAEQYERAASIDKRNKTAGVKLKTVRDAIQTAP